MSDKEPTSNTRATAGGNDTGGRGPAVLIAYGSQTGCAQSIASQLCADVRAFFGLASSKIELSELNQWAKRLDEFAKIPYVIILCSTTGAGDPPDNADRFWRAIRKRTVAPNIFEGLQFAVLALGDTNYDKFCQAGKRINKRLKVCCLLLVCFFHDTVHTKLD